MLTLRLLDETNEYGWHPNSIPISSWQCWRNEQEALTCIHEIFPQDYHPALILLDISLPKSEGIFFFRRFCTHFQQKCFYLPPIIVLTTYDCYSDLEVEQVITKPFHIKSLLSAVEQTLLHHVCKGQVGEEG